VDQEEIQLAVGVFAKDDISPGPCSSTSLPSPSHPGQVPVKIVHLTEPTSRPIDSINNTTQQHLIQKARAFKMTSRTPAVRVVGVGKLTSLLFSRLPKINTSNRKLVGSAQAVG
jgi:hypothetical protein